MKFFDYAVAIVGEYGVAICVSVFDDEHDLFNPGSLVCDSSLFCCFITGCKISEALKLRWDQVDFEAGTVIFPRTVNSNARILNLPDRLVEFLRDHPRISDMVFLSAEAEPWTTGGFYKVMAEDRSAVGLERHWDSFSFRHSLSFSEIWKDFAAASSGAGASVYFSDD